MAIYKTDDGYLISSNQVWLPGCYDTERTARYAFRFPNKILYDLQEIVNPGGVITFEMLQGYYRKHKESEN